MTIVRNAQTKVYEADIRDRVIKRLHVSLRTTKKAEAITRHAAVEALVREGDAAIVDLLRRRKVNVEAVEACVRERRPFSSLKAGERWPAVADAVAHYLAWLDANENKSAGTAQAADTALKPFVAFVAAHPDLGAAARLDDVTTEHLAAYQATLGALKPNTRRARIDRVDALYRFFARREETAARDHRRPPRALHSPVDRETRPREQGRRERWLTEAEAARVLAATPDLLKFPVAAGLLAGLRINEMLTLRPAPLDVDLSVGILIVQEKAVGDVTRASGLHLPASRRSLANRKGGMWRPKNRKRREVPICDDLRPILERHLERYASARWMVPALRDGAKPMHESTFRDEFRAAVRAAGLVADQRDPAGVTYHSLRHSFASWLVMRGVDLYTVAQLLGNKLEQVERVYAHLAPDHKRAAVARLVGAVPSLLPEEPAA